MRRKTGIQRKPRKRKKGATALKREWNIHPKAWMRYTGLKGVYWHYFSRTVRDRDYEEHEGLCMTCGLPVERGDDQAGHLFAARNCGFGLLFHPKNVHLQHSKCNNPRFTPDAGVRSAFNIERRYGVGTIRSLFALREKKTKEWSKKEYERRIKLLPAYLKTLQ